MATTTNPAVFFIPHSDDEVLSMGASIRLHADTGRECLAVLMTDGSGSSVGSKYPSKADFVAERDRAFRASCAALGATPVIRPDRAVDGTLTVAQAAAIMQEYATAYPAASLKTMSDRDVNYPESSNPDHYRLGQALRSIGFTDSRYYVRHRVWDRVGGFYSAYVDVRDALLAHTPVGWLSVRADFEFNWTTPTGTFGSRNKIHT